MTLPDRDQHRAEEAEQADASCPGPPRSSRRRPGRAPLEAARADRADLHRLVGLLDLVEQGLLSSRGADDLGAAVALGAVDQPGADRVHPPTPLRSTTKPSPFSRSSRVGSTPSRGSVRSPCETEDAPAVLDGLGEPGDALIRRHASIPPAARLDKATLLCLPPVP
jgi:hypothetical protein